MPRYQSGSVQFKTTDLNGGSAIDIGGVTQIGVSTGTETLSDDSGDLYDETRSIVNQSPVATWSTKSLYTMLSTVGLAGYCILSDGSHPGVRLFAKALGDCKSPPAGTDGAQYTFGTGLVVLNSLTARRGQDAQLSCTLHAITDGTNAPIASVYSSITFPARSALGVQQFVLGSCTIAGIALGDLDEVSINFGIGLTRRTPAMGSIWNDSIAVKKIQPSITFRSFDASILADAKLALAGVQGSHANTLIQLKKRINYASFVPNATAQHIQITANGIVTVPGAFSGPGTSEGTTVATLQGVHDGTNVPILFSLLHTYT